MNTLPTKPGEAETPSHEDQVRALDLKLGTAPEPFLIEDCYDQLFKHALGLARDLTSAEQRVRELSEIVGRFRYWTDGLLQDLPANRDWLDPETEDNIRTLVSEASNALLTPKPTNKE